jgi:hypothetical protein
MKKTIALLLSFYSIPLLPVNIPVSLIKNLKKAVSIYGNHLILDSAHALGHNVVAKIGLMQNLPETTPGQGYLTINIRRMPYIGLPFHIQASFPEFENKRFMNSVDLAGPAIGLLACYLQLKIANIYSEYSCKKTFIQNIKDGLAKPFYKGHSISLATIVGLHTIKNSWEIIPGNHSSTLNWS